ncbi:EamA family transporter [Methanoregula sp.]|uniref:EamA family transporter n=1 Tax=Methanoregula sp. TaxID=2052170 RepID=UPI0035693DFE
MMLWLVLALMGAASNAAYYIIIKRYGRHLDPRILTGTSFAMGGCLLLVFSKIQGFPQTGPDFFPAVAITTILNIVCLSLIFKVLESSDLSLSAPLLSFTPVFLICTSFLLLYELPSAAGVTGICIIVGGSYVLNIAGSHNRLRDPVFSMIKNRSSIIMLLVAFLFSISINYDKIVITNSDPFFGMALSLIATGFAFCILAGSSRISSLISGQTKPSADTPNEQNGSIHRRSKHSYWWLIPLMAIFIAIEAASINIALTLQIVPYVIAIKRLSIIFMVLYGTIMLAEKEIKPRLVGSTLMFIGAAVIILCP